MLFHCLHVSPFRELSSPLCWYPETFQVCLCLPICSDQAKAPMIKTEIMCLWGDCSVQNLWASGSQLGCLTVFWFHVARLEHRPTVHTSFHMLQVLKLVITFLQLFRIACIQWLLVFCSVPVVITGKYHKVISEHKTGACLVFDYIGLQVALLILLSW